MKYLITLLLAANVFAQDRAGNGGNFTKAQVAGHKATLEQTSSKIRAFLKINPELQKTFPEFSINDFYSKTEGLTVEVVNEEVFDKDGVKRTCTNFPDLIKCDANELEKIKDNASTLFVLMFHELLGTTGLVDEFRISDRIAAFVTKTQNYDLMLSKAVKVAEFPAEPMDEFEGHFDLIKGENHCPIRIESGRDLEHTLTFSLTYRTKAWRKWNETTNTTDWWIGLNEIHSDKWRTGVMAFHYYDKQFRKLTLAEDHVLRFYFGDSGKKGSYRKAHRAAMANLKLIQQMYKVNEKEYIYQATGKAACTYKKRADK